MQNSLQTVSYFRLADWVTFFAVLLLTAAAAFYGSKRLKKKQNDEKSALDYLLMGRQLTLPLFIATLVATWYGGIFGVNEITFKYGIYNFVTQGLFWYAAYIVFAFFIAQKVSRYKAITLPDLTYRMFGPKSARVSAWFTFFYIMPVASVLSVGIFLQMAFGMSLLSAMIAGTAFTILYISKGGFRSVVFSDVVQFIVMCSAVLLVAVFSVCKFGGFDFLHSHLPATHFTLTGGNSWLNTFVWGFIAFSALINPAFYQRCFAAKDLPTVKKGVLWATLIWFLFDICTTTGSLYARALLPQAEPDKAYFFYSIQLLPAGLRGFFAAGVLAIILSTLNSLLFIAANTLSFDLLKNRIKNVALSNQIALVIVGILAIGMTYLFNGSIKEIWLVLGSYFSACLLIPILMGYMYPKQISDNLFTCTVLCSAVMMTLWRFIPKNPFFQTLEPFYIGLLTGFCILFLFRKGGTHARTSNR